MIVKGPHAAILTFSAFLLTACAMPTQPVATEPDLVGLRIAQAAEKASSALDAISGIEQYREPQMPQTPDYSNAPAALTQTISVRWSGPLEQMAGALAEKAGMPLKTFGNRPPVPLLVNLDVYQKPLVEVLHDIGLQAGRRADVSVNNLNNAIEIHYAPVDRL